MASQKRRRSLHDKMVATWIEADRACRESGACPIVRLDIEGLQFIVVHRLDWDANIGITAAKVG